MPEQKFFALKEAARFLEMDWRQFKRYVDAGLFPQGIPSALNSKVYVWHRIDLKHMEWIYRNHERFKKSDSSDEKSAK